MSIKFRAGAVAAGILFGACAGSAALAGTVSYQGSNVFNTHYSNVGTVSFSSTDPSRSGSFKAGPFALTSDDLGDFLAWCIDIADNIKNGAEYVKDNSVFGGPGGEIHTNIDKLFSTFYADVDTKEEKSAFQFALWEILYDDGLDLDAGTFTDNNTNAAIRGIADGYLLGIQDPTAKMGGYKYTFLTSGPDQNPGNSQDLVTVTAVPVPAAGFLLIAGIGGLALMRRRG